MVPYFLTFSPGLRPVWRNNLIALLLGFTVTLHPLSAADLLHSTFETSVAKDNPWAGASTTGIIAVLPGVQPAVNSAGAVTKTQFGPSVTVGDLNGDGLQDLVIGDAHGFFWFYANSGTAAAPKFTVGEVMPIWFGATMDEPDYHWAAGGADNIVPRVQLVSFAGTKQLDLVIGNYNGRLFYLHNTGSTSQPVFRITPRLQKDCLVKTRKDGLLWCNFLSPFVYDWWGTGTLDLIMGDGSYSANSVFLFKNTGNRDNPTFNNDPATMTKIIPGMGREHLTPQVVDWNNDGKPDIIAGCEETSGATRVGRINVFLNTSADAKQPIPTFDAGHAVKLGSKDTCGDLPTVTVCDLTGNKLPNLIITNNHGDVSYVKNTGTLGSPQFADPVPIAATNPFPKVLRSIGWDLISPFGVPNELLVCTNTSVEPAFVPPPNTPFKSALRYYVYPIKNTYFPEFYYPVSDQLFDDKHTIQCSSEFGTKENTPYRVSFWIHSSGNITNLQYHLWGWRSEPGESEPENFDAAQNIGTGNSWNLFQDTISYSFKNKKKEERHESGATHFSITWNGQGEIYLDDVKVSTSQ